MANLLQIGVRLKRIIKKDIKPDRQIEIAKHSNLSTENDPKIERMQLMKVVDLKQRIKSSAVAIPQKLKRIIFFLFWRENIIGTRLIE